MLRVEEARELLLRRAPARRIGRLPLEQALGLIVAEDLLAQESLPTFARSGMDGYAVHASATEGATPEHPVILPLSGVIPAGHPLAESLHKGTCASIMTGGAIPSGADSVVRLEEVRVTPEGIQFHRPAMRGENVGPVGEDVAEGQVVLKAGHKIRPPEVNLLAAIGVTEVPVYLPPRVGILATGDELVPAGQAPGPGQIRNSNGPGLAAMVKAAGCTPLDLGLARDVTDVIAGAISHATECDLILTTGGVSVGDFDVVREALSVMGAEQLFWRVAIKPGTPVCGAVFEQRLVVGLSGNPAAAITNFDLLVRPLLNHLCGRERLGLRESEAILDQPVLRSIALTRFLRCRLYRRDDGTLGADTGFSQRAGVLSSMMFANGYAVVPARTGPLPAGTSVRVLVQEDAEL